MSVHNHGPNDGPGTFCRESLIGECLRAALAAPSTPEPSGLTGRDVHREWRDGMLAQGREVAPERMEWDTLDQRDRDLDDRIASRLQSAPSTEPALDVERVMQTCKNVGGYDPDDPNGWSDFASEFVEEYARLAESQS